MLYRRGKVWWYEFIFEGRRIRESSRTDSKTVARQAELKRRRDLQLSLSGLKRDRPQPFRVAAQRWIDTKTTLSPLGARYYRQYIRKLDRYFGNRFISEIMPEDVAGLQSARQRERLSPRQVNAEVGTLRAILRFYGCWAQISGRVRMLRQEGEAGRALSLEEEQRLIAAISKSRSPSLLPFFLLSLDAGLRPSETRALRRSSIRAQWNGAVITQAEILIGHSKTAAGAGRLVPLTKRARGALSSWFARFPEAEIDAFVFPFHRAAIAGNGRQPMIYDVHLDRAMSPSNYKSAFATACQKSGVKCRFYDARHTFITRLAENPSISEETIRQLAGHVNTRMLSRYAHIRVAARRAAIATLEQQTSENSASPVLPPQNPPQFARRALAPGREIRRKPRVFKGLELAPRAGFEPATRRLTAVCSTD